MVKKAFFSSKDAYTAPALKEVKTSIECGFAASASFGSDDYEDGNKDWLN